MDDLSRRGSLLDILRETGLEQYYSAFHQRGVRNSTNMASLTMQEYASLGITSMEERQRLFELVQRLKTPVKGENRPKNNNSTTPSRGSSSIGRRKSLSTSRGRLNKLVDADEEKKENCNSAERKIIPIKRAKTFTARSRGEINNTENFDTNQDKPQASLTPRTPLTRRQSSFKQQPTESSNSSVVYNYGVPGSMIRSASSKSCIIQQHGALGPRIRVCVRKRPLSMSEKQMGEIDITDITDTHTVVVNAPKVSVDLSKYIQQYKFVIDEALDEKCSNEEVYKRTAKPLIETIFNRGKATCFAYGCTGSGKTYTMMGTNDVLGIYLLAAQDIFTMVHSGNHSTGIFVVISFFEIYCGQLFDLLCDRKKVFAREDANHQVCITGLTERWVQNTEQLMDVIDYGNSVRSTGATGVNADSSRSHAIIQIQLKLPGNKKLGRISFIDLAGSERAADVTDTDKQTRMEGAEINQSLLALKECIRALDLDSKHTPFRQSKLTQVLKDSFIGNCQTCMIANISPSMGSSENTLNTLRYADRVKEMKRDDVSDTPSDVECAGNTEVLDLTGENTENIQAVQQVKTVQEGCTLPQVRTESTDLSTENNPKWLKRSLEQLKNKMACRNTSTVPHCAVTSEKKSTLPVREELKRPATSPVVIPLENTRKNSLSHRHNSSKGGRNTAMLAPSVCKKRELLNERLRELNQDLKILPSKSLNNLMDWNSEEDLLSEKTSRQSKNSKFMCTNHSDNTTTVLQARGQTKLLRSESTKKKKPQGIVRPNTVHGSMQNKEENNKSTSKQETQSRHNNRTPPQTPNYRYGNRRNSPTHCRNPPASKGALSQQGSEESSGPYSRDSTDAFFAQEQLVSAHQTQLAQVTRLCKQEMELLRDADSNRENFEEYIGQLDEILAQKMSSIAALRNMIAGFSSD